jgi:hypothetical protein
MPTRNKRHAGAVWRVVFAASTFQITLCSFLERQKGGVILANLLHQAPIRMQAKE